MNELIYTLFPSSNPEILPIIWVVISVIWIYVVLWTARDIYARSDNSFFQLFCVVLVAAGSPIVGLPLYLLIRPLSRKEDVMGRQMMMDLESIECNACHRQNLIGHDHCVFCGSALKNQCKNCKEMYPHTHQYCCKCGAPNITWKE